MIYIEFGNTLLKIFSLHKMDIYILLKMSDLEFGNMHLKSFSLHKMNIYILLKIPISKLGMSCQSEVKVSDIPELRQQVLAVCTLFGVLCL